MPKNKIQSNLGFTLIELLVVISIIGFLASIAVYALNVARMKARDARRLADFTQIQKALDLYYHENSFYPKTRAYTSSSSCGSNWCVLQTSLAPYLKNLPRDPAGLQTAYIYYYESDSGDNYQTYGLMARLEYKGNYPLASTDGGWYSSSGSYYEVGSQPQYCKAKSPSENWWESVVTVCSSNN